MQWEYQMIVMQAEKPGFLSTVAGQFDEATLLNAMNQLGSQEWELVSGFDTNRWEGATRSVVLLFKRPKLAAATLVPE